MSIDQHLIERLLFHANKKDTNNAELFGLLNKVLGSNIPEYIQKGIAGKKIDIDRHI